MDATRPSELYQPSAPEDEHNEVESIGQVESEADSDRAAAGTQDAQHAVHFALPPLSHAPPDHNDQGLPVSFATQDGNNAWATSSTPSSSLPATPSTSSLPALTADMWFGDNSNDHIEIVIPSDNVVLRGVGQDVEPTILAGQVIVHLEENTNIRDINLTFVGKLRTPQGEPRPPTFRQNIATNVFFSQDWSFLEGNKSHKHTLKAGQHTFPFQLTIDDTFPSSVAVSGASIVYKLRATVVRSSFSSNWVTQRYVNIIRGFSQEALEYNQTLEIENTWPGKIMYSVMIPHKAYAAGDEIPVSLKFTPLVKGCTVLAIDTVIKQYLSIRSRGASPLQDGRIVVKGSHVIRNAQAVDLSLVNRSPTTWDVNHAYGRAVAVTALATSAATASALGQAFGNAASAGPSTQPEVEDPERGDDEIDTSLTLRLPAWVTPSNATDPITVHHKIKWSITLSNLDGHTSELRCALPIHILHPSLLEESRTASQQTRAILFGNTEATQTQTVLPSYASHVQDRIANALDPVVPVRLAPNPLHMLEAAGPSTAGSRPPTGGSQSQGGYFSAARAAASHSGSPAAGPSSVEDTPQLGLVDTGLLLSLGDSAQFVTGNANAASGSHSRNDTPPESRRSSFRTNLISSSRTSSRASSPEPRELDLPAAGTSAPTRSGLFSNFSLKPFTHFSSKSHKTSQLHVQSNPSSPQFGTRALGSRSRQSSIVGLRSEFLAGADLGSMQVLTDLMSRVPNYERASQGFLGGGVPPLDASAGLPTYNEIDGLSRVRSDGALLDLRGSESRTEASSSTARQSETTIQLSDGRRRNATFTLDP